MAKKATLTPEEQAAKDLADLQKKAKKLKVDFSADTSAEELALLVDAAEKAKAAQKEQKEKDAALPAPATGGSDAHANAAAVAENQTVAPASEDQHQSMAVGSEIPAPEEPEAPAPVGEAVIKTLTLRNKEMVKLVREKGTKTEPGNVKLKNKFGVVLADFGNGDTAETEGQRHLENLSRF